MHVALLGDSIFDNAPYTSGAPDVVAHLRRLLPNAWTATLLALDGSLIQDLQDQVAAVPKDATHVVVSIGGNNVLGYLDVLRVPVRSIAEAFLALGKLAEIFERAYREAIGRVGRLGLLTTLCTIYNGNLDPEEAEVATLALRAFNDVILRVAFEASYRVIDLRLVCTEPADYANPIEPSDQGGRKIARAITSALGIGDPAPHCAVYF